MREANGFPPMGTLGSAALTLPQTWPCLGTPALGPTLTSCCHRRVLGANGTPPPPRPQAPARATFPRPGPQWDPSPLLGVHPLPGRILLQAQSICRGVDPARPRGQRCTHECAPGPNGARSGNRHGGGGEATAGVFTCPLAPCPTDGGQAGRLGAAGFPAVALALRVCRGGAGGGTGARRGESWAGTAARARGAGEEGARAAARARGLSLPPAAGEEMAGGTAPSAGRHSGLDGLARPARLSHMRLELETRAPGLEHERARLGGLGGGGGTQPRLACPWPPVEHEPQFLLSLCPLRPLHAHLEGQGHLPKGVKWGPRYWQEPIGILDGERGWESGSHVLPSQPWSCSRHPATSQPHGPPGTFLPQSRPCCTRPPPVHLPSTLSRGGHTPAAEGLGTSSVTASSPHYPPPHPQPSLSHLGFWFPFPPSPFPVSVPVCLSLPPSVTHSLAQERQVLGTEARGLNLDGLMSLVLTKPSARKVFNWDQVL